MFTFWTWFCEGEVLGLPVWSLLTILLVGFLLGGNLYVYFSS